MHKCEKCDQPVDPKTAWWRVTGWGKPSSKGVKELLEISSPFGFRCDNCMFDSKMKGQQETIF